MRVELIDLDAEFGGLQRVTNHKCFVRNKYTADGLFSEQIFGPCEDYKCQCGRYQGREYTNKVCENCGVMITTSNSRLSTFAKIDIPDECCTIHPLVLQMMLGLKLKGLNGVNVGRLVRGRELAYFDESGRLRKAIRGTEAAELYGRNGPMFFKQDLYPYLLSKNEILQAFDKEYGKYLFIHTLPVIPPDTRMMSISTTTRVRFSEEINVCYDKILRTLQQIEQSPHLTDMAVVMIQIEVEKLFETLLKKYEHKNGFLRSHVLGKRVDYSGRAVIVVDGGDMPLGYCKIPFAIAKEIYKPSIISGLAERLKVNQLSALEKYDLPSTKPILLNLLRERFINTYVILNRQPSLHRPSIQSMRIYDIIEEDVIVVHPLVCEAYNADFDGDQMAIYVPHTEAVKDAHEKMWIDNNCHLPSNGKSLFNLSQDMILGLNTLTKKENTDECVYMGIDTTVGRVEVFETAIPEQFRTAELFKLFNIEFNKKTCNALIEDLEDILPQKEWINAHHYLCKLGFKKSCITISLNDFNIPFKKNEADFDVSNIPDNNATRMIRSGARGSMDQYRQMVWEKGYISDVLGRILPTPVTSSLCEGLTKDEYFTTCYGGRKGLIDTADNTAKSGYLTRKLIYLLFPQKISTKVSSCKHDLNKDYTFEFFVRDEQTAKMLLRRYTTDGLIMKQNYKNIIGKTIHLYSPITCSCEDGICRHCYGELYDIHKSKMIGIIAAQSLGERGTQLTLRTKHTSGSTEDKLGELNKYIEYKNGVFVAKIGGKLTIDENGSVSFIFEDNETFIFEDYESFDPLLDESIDDDSLTLYYFNKGDDIAKVCMASQDVVSAIACINSKLMKPGDNVSIQDFLYQLIDLYGSFATVDLIHFELIVSMLCRNANNVKKPHRLEPYLPYCIVGMNEVIDGIPEQGIAFEQFKKRVYNILNNGEDEIFEAGNLSLLKSMTDFVFDENEVPEASWR